MLSEWTASTGWHGIWSLYNKTALAHEMTHIDRDLSMLPRQPELKSNLRLKEGVCGSPVMRD
jgi:hypothetical protein